MIRQLPFCGKMLQYGIGGARVMHAANDRNPRCS